MADNLSTRVRLVIQIFENMGGRYVFPVDQVAAAVADARAAGGDLKAIRDSVASRVVYVFQ